MGRLALFLLGAAAGVVGTTVAACLYADDEAAGRRKRRDALMADYEAEIEDETTA